MKVVTITGIRPDFIRMSALFEKLDERFEHVMIHTGQHYDDELSGVFFKELKIRRPDFVLSAGAGGRSHYEQLAYLSVEVVRLLERERIRPDVVLFLGDSNSVLASVPLFKEGYRIGHVEGGMRSYDRRMPEEVNRVLCDYVSDLVFVYTPLYKERLLEEKKDPSRVFVVGNTIVEVVRKYMPTGPRSRDTIVADIHRNENLKDPARLAHILKYLDALGSELGMDVQLVRFPRAVRMIEAHDLLRGHRRIRLAGPFGFLDYLHLQYGARVVVSDSGTCQEECPLLGVPVAVPRDHTERPESLTFGNSILVGETAPIDSMVRKTLTFLDAYASSDESIRWLGDGRTAQSIVKVLETELAR